MDEEHEHDWSEWKPYRPSPIGGVEGEYRTCDCGTKQGRPHEHSWRKWIPGTGTVSDSEYRTCRICRESEGRAASSHEHDWRMWAPSENPDLDSWEYRDCLNGNCHIVEWRLQDPPPAKIVVSVRVERQGEPVSTAEVIEMFGFDPASMDSWNVQRALTSYTARRGLGGDAFK